MKKRASLTGRDAVQAKTIGPLQVSLRCFPGSSKANFTWATVSALSQTILYTLSIWVESV